MVYAILIGIVIAIFAIAIYMFKQNKSSETVEGLSWQKCFSNGTIIYLLSLFLGSFSTSIVENITGHSPIEFLTKVLSQTFAILLYAIAFTFFLVLPGLVIGLKSISRSSLTTAQKEIRFILINIILVLIINLIMTGFMTNWEFAVFLSGFSFFGIVTPWAYIKIRKVF